MKVWGKAKNPAASCWPPARPEHEASGATLLDTLNLISAEDTARWAGVEYVICEEYSTLGIVNWLTVVQYPALGGKLRARARGEVKRRSVVECMVDLDARCGVLVT